LIDWYFGVKDWDSHLSCEVFIAVVLWLVQVLVGKSHAHMEVALEFQSYPALS